MIFTVVFYRKKANAPQRMIVSAAALAAVLWLCCYQAVFIAPVSARSGTQGEIQARVEKVEAGYHEERVRVILRIETVDGEAVSFSAVCDDFPAVEAGDRVKTDAIFHTFVEKERRQYYPDGVFIAMDCGGDCTLLTPEPASAGAWFNHLRKKSSALLQAVMPGENGQIMAAAVTGDRDAVQRETRLSFQKAGVSHVLVVSGLHLSIVALGMWTFLKKVFHRRRPAALAALFVLAGYMLFTGLSASVLRAGIMTCFVLTGELFRKKSDSVTSLGAAALLLALINPYAASDAGVLFSFTATLGVLCAGGIKKKADAKDVRGWKKIPARFFSVAAAPVFAAVFTLPVQIWVGGSVSVFSILANLLVVPVLQPLLLCGMAALFLFEIPWLKAAAGFFVFLSQWLLLYLRQIVAFVAAIPFGRIALTGTFALVSFIIVACAGLLLWKRKKRVLALTVCIGLAFFSWETQNVLSQGTFTIAEVGYGKNPAVVLIENGEAAVFYRGGVSNIYAVQRYLEGRGVDKIVFLTNMEKRMEETDFQQTLGRRADINMREETFFGETKQLFHDIILTMERHPSGAVCRIDTEGYSFLITAGSVDLRGAPKASVFLPGSGRVKGAQFETVVCTQALPRWLTPNGAQIYIWQDTPELFVRPGKNLQIQQRG